MDTVRQLLQAKGHDIWAVPPESAVLDALKLMADKNIGAVLVIDHGNLVGILSERDYARKVVLRGRASKNTPVREIMTERVVCVHPSRPVEECLALMTSGHLRHLPVVEDGRLIGVISIMDVVKTIIANQSSTIGSLETYILGSVSLTTGIP
jgi:CBS domain-containing protein